MTQQATADAQEFRPLGTRFLTRVFVVFAALAALSGVISISGKMLGRSIQMAGRTDDTTLHEIVIGDDVLAVPANAIRFKRQRRDGVQQRLDLYLRWPDMSGYSRAAAEDFNHADGSNRILFLSFEQRSMTYDMSGRLAPIYRTLIAGPGRPGPAGLTAYGFKPDSGYGDELLFVAEGQGETPFVARCLDGPAARSSLAGCERDIHVGTDLSLVYRFPRHLLDQWRAIDAAIVEAARRFRRKG